MIRLVALIAAILFASPLAAQEAMGPPVAGAPETVDAAGGVERLNPASMLEDAAEALPGYDGGLSGALNVMVLLTVLSLAPAIVIMCTSFVRIIIVLALLRQAMGTQNLPPSQVIFALALFMTFMVMTPTIERVYAEAITPYQNGEIQSQIEMWDRAKQPVRDFMFDQIEATGNWSSLYMILNYKGVDTSEPEAMTRADVDTLTLASAFMLSELKTAFVMGFRIYLPFLVIDIVIASLLISMSMMMLPPVLISLPFKILLFVLVDGWQLVVGGLLQSFAQAGDLARLSAQAVGGG
jgi:flagellar biosynthesis protein FliP